jgi:hypothetical protein
MPYGWPLLTPFLSRLVMGIQEALYPRSSLTLNTGAGVWRREGFCITA